MKKILAGKALFDRLNAENWQDILPKLHYYALNKLQRFVFLNEQYDVPGLAAQFADEAVELVWEEQRKWNTDYYDDLYAFLKGIVDSMIYNYVNSKEVRVTESLPDVELIDLEHGSVPNPEQDMIVKEIEAEIKRLLAEDEKAAAVFDCLKDGLKPREIAEELNWDVNEVYSTLKRVQRKLKGYKHIG